jgi:thiamine pyrophosphokinase
VQKRILGVLAGNDMPTDLLNKWAASADILVAADAGADWLLRAGCPPNVIVGDLDSISDATRFQGADICHIPDQSYTDCDKLLQVCAERYLFPITLACVEGNRLDHVLSTLSSVAKSSIVSYVRLALREGLAWILLPGSTEKDVGKGRTVSLIPFGECIGVSTSGLKWNLTDSDLSTAGPVSISNQSTESVIGVRFTSGVMLLHVLYEEGEFPIW